MVSASRARSGDFVDRPEQRPGTVAGLRVMLHAAVERRAMNTQEFGSLRQVALSDCERSFDISALPLAQRPVEIKPFMQLQLAFGRFEESTVIGLGCQRSAPCGLLVELASQ